MPTEPDRKDVVAFVDGQNLYHAAREAFGYSFPNFDISSLTGQVCADKGWNLIQTRFYTGVPDPADNQKWHDFWRAKTAKMGRQGVYIYTRSLRYRNKAFMLPDGTKHTLLVGEEKGIDVRIALDIISLAHSQAYDVALVFSQDQDLSEVADEVRKISIEQSRWIKMASAFPTSPTSGNRRGINKTDWVPIDRAAYDGHIDRRNYFKP
ncbi:MAG: NYN domain-containing protein [Rhodospirillaceae bacterium]|jgi:uncharacterized LabA/DUF88 family protein|nr:NYN domain-containing protein [Rhodospirillaceae bacterium]|tara:strand:+ start:1509 stop:2132 length:624 start_codon:yes stop_codon:yes gene_type:complete